MAAEGSLGGVATLVPSPDTDAAEVVIGLQQRFAASGMELPIRLWDGRALGPSDAGFRLVLHHPWSLRALLVPPTDLQAGETYLAGAVDVEGSMVAALRELRRFRDGLTTRGKLSLARSLLSMPRPPQRSVDGRVRLRGRRHSQGRDAAAIRHHYDVGDELYHRFLDEDLVYSCAYFAESDREAPVTDRSVLDRAQRRKLELVCRKLRLRPGERLLDVGCGWGSLAIHAARYHDVEVVGVTLSKNQAATARERVAAAGLADRVRIELTDYRDVTDRFDAIASIGMVEHVGAEQLAAYVAHLYDRLEEGGRLLNHGITTGQRNVVTDLAASPDSFIGRYVFPDGALVPAHQMVSLFEQGGFEIRDVEQLRPHYARTLQHWVANIEVDYDASVEVVGAMTARVWRAYMAGSSVGFETGDLGVVQILATRGLASLPFDREHLADLGDGRGPSNRS
ncbi:MAG: class I SAM-dependent methyltransferase [Nitriliruptoraceae bacterium]